MNEYSFTLSRHDYEILLIMLGFATGAAAERGETKLVLSFVRLTNEINKNNPHWTNYEVRADKENHDGV